MEPGGAELFNPRGALAGRNGMCLQVFSGDDSDDIFSSLLFCFVLAVIVTVMAVLQVIAHLWNASSPLGIALASPQHAVVTHEANIEQIVKAVKFKDDLVAAEELLSAFHLVDLLGPA